MPLFRMSQSDKESTGLAPIALLFQAFGHARRLVQPDVYRAVRENWSRHEASLGGALGSFAQSLPRQSV